MDALFEHLVRQLKEAEAVNAQFPKQIRVNNFCPAGTILSVPLWPDHPRAPGYELVISSADWDNMKKDIRYAVQTESPSIILGIPVVTE